MRTLSRADAEDLVEGAAILGVGGGGDPEKGLRSLYKQHDAGRKLELASIDEFREGDILASPYFVGSVAPKADESSTLDLITNPIATAFQLLEEKLQRKISGTVASEIGGGNTPASFAIAAELGIPMLDGDLMGRAGPELHQSTVHIFGLAMTPSAVVSSSGNKMLVERYASIDDYEALARYASVISRGHVAVVDTPLTKEEAKRCAIQGTISRCIELGEIVRTSRGNAPDAVAAKLLNGKIVFSGTVSEYTWRDERGFLFGEAIVEGTGESEGRKLRSWIMNEHIICWLDDRPRIMSPDLTAFLDPDSGKAITNTNLAKGRSVKVLGASIDSVWRTPRGIELFGPRHFGFDFDYVPFENIQTGLASRD